MRTVERLTDTARTLAVISNATPGVRLSTLLYQPNLLLDSQAALCLVRQMVAAMATFHEFAPEAAHGALGPNASSSRRMRASSSSSTSWAERSSSCSIPKSGTGGSSACRAREPRPLVSENPIAAIAATYLGTAVKRER